MENTNSFKTVWHIQKKKKKSQKEQCEDLQYFKIPRSQVLLLLPALAASDYALLRFENRGNFASHVQKKPMWVITSKTKLPVAGLVPVFSQGSSVFEKKMAFFSLTGLPLFWQIPVFALKFFCLLKSDHVLHAAGFILGSGRNRYNWPLRNSSRLNMITLNMTPTANLSIGSDLLISSTSKLSLP